MLEAWARLPACQEQLQSFPHPILKPWLQLCAMRLTGGTNYLTLAVSGATVTSHTAHLNVWLMSTLTFIGAGLLVNNHCIPHGNLRHGLRTLQFIYHHRT